MVIPNDGKNNWLLMAVEGGAQEDFEVRLYTNDYTPVDGSIITDFTAATFAGSGAVTITPADWDAPAVVANVAQIDATTPPTWTHGGGAAQLCYGWYMVGVTSSAVYAAQRFDAARNMTAGSVESLDPFRLKLKSFA
jgi:hypothetical protein